MENCGIYKITNPSNSSYIGQSVNIKKRLNKYKNGNCKLQHKLYRSFVKYGIENHVFEILETCEASMLNEREIFYIGKYNSCKNGLNIQLGGRGGNISNESREKISAAMKGRVFSEETKIKMGNASRGRVLSDDAKRKIGEKSKGRYFSPETRLKMSLFHKGKKRSDTERKRLSENNPNAKIVINLENGIFYENAKLAQKSTNYNLNTFYNYLSGKITNKTCFRYAN